MSKKVLIIDDDAGIIDVISIILQSEGFEVKALDDDTDFLEEAIDFKPDLILLDIWMPGLGGKEICRRLKADNKMKTVPVMLVSASVNIDQICKECGADGFITKPFEMEELIDLVNHKVKS